MAVGLGSCHSTMRRSCRLPSVASFKGYSRTLEQPSVVSSRRMASARSAQATFPHAPRASSLRSRSRRVPPDLDDVTIRVADLHAHVVRLVPPLDDVDAVRLDAIPKGTHVVGAGGATAE